jgi:hypothetical protein
MKPTHEHRIQVAQIWDTSQWRFENLGQSQWRFEMSNFNRNIKSFVLVCLAGMLPTRYQKETVRYSSRIECVILKTEIAQSRMIIRAAPEWPMIFAIGFFDRQVIDARKT